MDQNTMKMLALSAGREGQRVVADEFFTYSIARTSIAPAATAVANISIEANSDFLVEKMTYFADVAAAAQTESTRVIPLITVQVNATGSGRNMFNVPAAIPNIFGTGQMPFILPRPYFLPAASTLQITMVSFEAANTDLVSLSFMGRKIFWTGNR